MFKFESESPWITKIMTDKFNMYAWHLQKVRDQKNYKWLQNMFYNLIQQVIWQSSVYYLAYVAFWEDHNHCLIFYSYYTKYQSSDDQIFFQHIDLNIFCLVKNHKDAYLIQESMSLNTEQADDCMKFLMNMHWHLDAWWDNIQQRLKTKNKKILNELIHKITHNEWTKKNITKYKMNFKAQPCCKNQIYVSLSHLFHRAQSVKDMHKTILF